MITGRHLHDTESNRTSSRVRRRLHRDVVRTSAKTCVQRSRGVGREEGTADTMCNESINSVTPVLLPQQA